MKDANNFKHKTKYLLLVQGNTKQILSNPKPPIHPQNMHIGSRSQCDSMYGDAITNIYTITKDQLFSPNLPYQLPDVADNYLLCYGTYTYIRFIVMESNYNAFCDSGR